MTSIDSLKIQKAKIQSRLSRYQDQFEHCETDAKLEFLKEKTQRLRREIAKINNQIRFLR